MSESDKHFLWSLAGATGVILFWKGIWEGVGGLPIIASPWVSLFLGLVILTFSGLIFREFDPLGGIEKGVLKVLSDVQHHPKKHEFHIIYFDSIQKKNVKFMASDIRHIEKNSMSVHEKGREIFIPIHRVLEIHRNGEIVWKV